MTHSKLNHQGLWAALGAAASWGMSGIFVRWLSGWSPFAVLSGRFLVATVAMLPLLFVVSHVDSDWIRSLRRPLIWGLSLPAIGSYVLGTTAFQLAPIGEVTLLFTTSPLFIICHKYCSGQTIRRDEWVGMLLAMTGVSLILFPQLSAPQSIAWQTLSGYVLAIGAAGSLAIYTIWFNKLTKQNIAPKSIDVVFVTCLLGCILCYLCELLFFNPTPVITLNLSDFLVLSELGILSTAFPFLCYTLAAQRLPVVLTTAILLLEPMFAVLFATIALGERPSLWFGMGSVLVFWGILTIGKGTDSA